MLQQDLPLVRQQAIPEGAELKDCAPSGAKEPNENNHARHAATAQRFHRRTLARPGISYALSITYKIANDPLRIGTALYGMDTLAAIEEEGPKSGQDENGF